MKNLGEIIMAYQIDYTDSDLIDQFDSILDLWAELNPDRYQQHGETLEGALHQSPHDSIELAMNYSDHFDRSRPRITHATWGDTWGDLFMPQDEGCERGENEEAFQPGWRSRVLALVAPVSATTASPVRKVIEMLSPCRA